MRRTVHQVSAWLLIALSVLHVAATPFVFEGMPVRAFWFVGQGLMGLFAAFLNLAAHAVDGSVPRVQHLTVRANVIGLAFVVASLYADPSPQGLVAVVLFLALTASARSADHPR